jgi:polygalacturonase
MKDEMKQRYRLGLFVIAALSLWGIAQVTSTAQVNPVKVSPVLPTIPQRKFSLADFGAVGDGKTLNTDAFRKAVAACRKAGGGEVVVPAGVFVTGPFALADNMALVLSKGATIRGTETFADYDSTKSCRSLAARI